MTKEQNEVMVGFDLCYESSQITFYHKKNIEPKTVSAVAEGEKYQIPTPKDMFPLVEQRAELGVALLFNFFKTCFDKLPVSGGGEQFTVMVTMEKMKPVWAKAIVEALEMLEIPRERVYLQEHLESFFYYALSQKRELWNARVALFEYGRERITGYELSIDYRTKPAFVHVEKKSHIYLDEKARNGEERAAWDKTRDRLFLEQAQKMMREETFSAVYLVGDYFDQEWPQKTLHFLCNKRHVFQGKNLYTKGACYGAMNQTGADSIGNFLYDGPDMIEYNIGMSMLINGQEHYHNMISAGINFYMAFYECEFILDATEEIVLHSRSMNGERMSHTIELTGLPNRPNRATRIRLQLVFTAKNKCRVHLDDCGLGELYPASGKKWEAVIEL